MKPFYKMHGKRILCDERRQKVNFIILLLTVYDKVVNLFK